MRSAALKKGVAAEDSRDLAVELGEPSTIVVRFRPLASAGAQLAFQRQKFLEEIDAARTGEQLDELLDARLPAGAPIGLESVANLIDTVGELRRARVVA
jgi:hypothetical protein